MRWRVHPDDRSVPASARDSNASFGGICRQMRRRPRVRTLERWIGTGFILFGKRRAPIVLRPGRSYALVNRYLIIALPFDSSLKWGYLMDDQRFDALTKRIGSGMSRRALFKGFRGLGGAAATVAVVQDQTDAARRGFAGPKLPTPTPPPCDPVGTACQGDSTCCTGLCGGVFPGDICCIASGQSCDINNPGQCCTGCCITTGVPGEYVCCS